MSNELNNNTLGGGQNTLLLRRRMMVKSGEIPGYTSLKYLQTSGKQYIISPIFLTPYLKIEASLEPLSFTSTSQQTGCVYHYNVSGGTNFCGFLFRLSQSASYTDVYYRNNLVSNTCASSGKLGVHTYIYDGVNNKIQVDELSPSSITNPITSTFPNAKFPIGIRYDYSSSGVYRIQLPCTMKIYSTKSWVSSLLEHHLVPKLRNSDNKPGLYDIVTGIFYTNNGTGEFGYEKLDGTYVTPV